MMINAEHPGMFGLYGGRIGVVSERSCWKIHLCLIETMSGSSTMVPAMVKAEPIKNSSKASVVRGLYLRTTKKKLFHKFNYI